MTVLIAVTITITMQSTGSNANAIDSTDASFASLGEVGLFVSSSGPGVFPTAPLHPANTESVIAAVPGVAGTVPGQMAYATVGRTRVLIQGLSAGSIAPPIRAMTDDARHRLLAEDGVVISRDVARSMHLRAGDELRLQTPTGDRRVQILQGVPFFSLLGGVVSMSLPQLRDWFDRPGTTILAVNLTPVRTPRRSRRRSAPNCRRTSTCTEAKRRPAPLAPRWPRAPR